MPRKKPRKISKIAWLSFTGQLDPDFQSFYEGEELYVPRQVGDTFRIRGHGYSMTEHCVILDIHPWDINDVKYTLVGMTQDKDGFYPVLGFISLKVLEQYALEGRLTK